MLRNRNDVKDEGTTAGPVSTSSPFVRSALFLLNGVSFNIPNPPLVLRAYIKLSPLRGFLMAVISDISSFISEFIFSIAGGDRDISGGFGDECKAGEARVNMYIYLYFSRQIGNLCTEVWRLAP